jgi:uncharacterized Zn finger protein (UPF0148 family)
MELADTPLIICWSCGLSLTRASHGKVVCGACGSLLVNCCGDLK